MNWSPLLPADATLREPGPPQVHTSGEDGSMKCPEGAGDPCGALQACDPTGSTGQVLGTPDVCLSKSQAGGSFGFPHVAPPLRSPAAARGSSGLAVSITSRACVPLPLAWGLPLGIADTSSAPWNEGGWGLWTTTPLSILHSSSEGLSRVHPVA